MEPVENPGPLVDSDSTPGGAELRGISFRGTFRALRHRNYRLFFFGQLISLIGTWMQQTAMGWLVYQITGSKLLLGVIAAAGSAPMVLFSLWGGSLADRHSKRAILVITQTAQMLLAFVLAGAVSCGFVTPWLITTIALLNGVSMGFDMPTRQAFIVEMTSREDLFNAISLNSSVFNGARIVGPSLAGLLMGAFGIAACFFVNGLSYIAVIAGLLMMRLPASVSSGPSLSARSHALSGLAYVAQNVRVRTILMLFGIVGVFGWPYAVLLPSIARDVLGVGAHGYGLLVSAGGIGALAGALTVAAVGHAFHPRKLVFGGVWLFSATLLGVAVSRNFYLCMILLGFTGFGMLLFLSTLNTTLQSIVPDEMRGRVMGVWALVFGVMVPLGSLVAGVLAHWIGSPATIAIGAIVCAITAFVTLRMVQRRDRQEVQPT